MTKISAFALAASMSFAGCLLALPSHAQEGRVSIPADCRELAHRYHVPLMLTHPQARGLIPYILTMPGQDPAVARCQLAVRGLVI